MDVNITELIAEAKAAGVQFEIVDGELVIGTVPSNKYWLKRLLPHRAAILAVLQGEEAPVDPEPPPPTPEPYQEFPVDCLPEPLRGFVVAGSKAIDCDPSYVALPLLAACGAAIGNTRRLRMKRSWTVPPILWTAIVGESGTSKTPAFRLALRAIRQRQQAAMADYAKAAKDYEADLLVWEKTLAEWRRDKKTMEPAPEKPDEPKPERFVVSDTTVEALATILRDNPRGLLLARDELAGWIGSFDRYASGGRGADSAHWLSMHCGESLTVDRKTGTTRTITVPRAAVSICGGIQPGILARVMNAEHREAGLLARLLLACPPRRIKRWSEADVTEECEDAVAAVLMRLYDLLPEIGDDGQPRPITIHLTPEAKRVWIDHYNSHAKVAADREGDLAAAYSKLEEVPARLALILHYCSWAAGNGNCVDVDNVDESTIASAVTLGQWFCREADRVYDLLSESAADRQRRLLVTWIERRGGIVTAREVQQGFREYRTALAAEAALQDLVTCGYGVWVLDSHQGKRGRPVRRFRLSTLSTQYTNAKNTGEKGNCVDVDSVDTSKNSGSGNNGNGKIDPNDLFAEAAEGVA